MWCTPGKGFTVGIYPQINYFPPGTQHKYTVTNLTDGKLTFGACIIVQKGLLGSHS